MTYKYEGLLILHFENGSRGWSWTVAHGYRSLTAAFPLMIVATACKTQKLAIGQIPIVFGPSISTGVATDRGWSIVSGIAQCLDPPLALDNPLWLRPWAFHSVNCLNSLIFVLYNYTCTCLSRNDCSNSRRALYIFFKGTNWQGVWDVKGEVQTIFISWP